MKYWTSASVAFQWMLFLANICFVLSFKKNVLSVKCCLSFDSFIVSFASASFQMTYSVFSTSSYWPWLCSWIWLLCEGSYHYHIAGQWCSWESNPGCYTRMEGDRCSRRTHGSAVSPRLSGGQGWLLRRASACTGSKGKHKLAGLSREEVSRRHMQKHAT